MLSREKILDATCSGLNVFRHYIPGDWKVRRNFRNPLYDDINPSCNIYLDRKSGAYRMKDFGNDDYSGDCFYIVGKIKGYDCSIPKDFIEILRTINHDLFLGIEDEHENRSSVPAPKSQPLPKRIEVTEVQTEANAEVEALPYYAHSKPYSASELDYWLSYGINKETLRRFRVVSLSYFESQSRQGKPYRIESLAGEPVFGYEHPNFIKIYRPLSAMRFMYGGDDFKDDCNKMTCPSNAIPDGWEGMDIGPATEKVFAEVIKNSKTILWNGPAGVFEMDSFAGGSRAVAQAIVDATAKGAYSLIGGGDSVACINKFGMADKVSYVSTGGGALLEYMEGLELPGVAAIRK